MDDIVRVAALVGAAFAMGIGTIGPALGQGMVGTKACETIGKYPENAGKVRTAMMLAMVLIETSAIYALLISLLLILLT